MSKEKDSVPSGERLYQVRYRLPGEEGRTPRKITLIARNQSDATKTLIASIPTAKVIGGAKSMNESIELDEGLLDYAIKIKDFLKRCVGYGCLKYAETPIRGNKDSVGVIGKRLARELAQHAGERMIRSGGGEPRTVKIKMAKKKRKSKGSFLFGASGAKRKRKKR